MSAYYSYAPVFVNDLRIVDPGFKMSFGQMSEILFMIVIPLLYARLGVRWMIGAGMGAWLLRQPCLLALWWWRFSCCFMIRGRRRNGRSDAQSGVTTALRRTGVTPRER